ncbi:regulator [Herbiconiux moechotypicola]|uniref:PaaX family transcriptional regulator C-terminal domain-containing protein n=1 Tax=Herbiconiux moechotypicola TaxID=637393 RepID=A0ABN3DZW2_9MICO|nr:PaaX family transcriptional regulator C-terminal domain-containing protein [Herbiconiux moechotypicola]MCS5731133.1 regulator [Herbiconiux moechotypicola]
MSEILDDMDSRPGSTTSLLRTVLGLYLRQLGGWIAVADLLELMEALDVPAPRTRTALVRVKKKSLVVPETRDKVAGYSLVPEAATMLARGDRRIYHPRNMGPESRWCVVSFSIPEENRHLRHQLRRRLHWIGCGTVSPALWICPAYLAGEVEEILDDLELREHSTVFIAERPRVAGDLRQAIEGWWDLDEIRGHHEAFLEQHAADGLVPTDPPVSAREAFAIYIRSVDTWRIIPYIDPGLPAGLLPDDWPGDASNALLLELRERFSGPATDFVSEVTGTAIADPALGASPALTVTD